jgi:hypothetical protein
MRLREGVEVRPTLIDETFAVRPESTGSGLGSDRRPARGVINFALATIACIALCAASASTRVSNEKLANGRPSTPMMLKP